MLSRIYLLGIVGVLLGAAVASAQTPSAPTAATKAVSAGRRPLVTEGILSAKTERVAPNRAAFTLTTKPDVAAKLKLLDAQGAEVAVTKTPEGLLKADVDLQRAYILARPIPERATLRKDGAEFPARYVTFTPAGAPNLGGLFLRPAVVPLTWSDDAKAYTTELLIGYEFEDGRETALAAPKTVTFFAEGANARIQENRVTVERSGGSGYKRVQLFTGQVDGETHFTARAGPADELKSSVAIQREIGGIKLSLASTELPAFGVGSGELTVSLVARDGMPLPAPRALEIQLSSRRLHQPATVVVDQGKSTASADLRTAGYGADQIVAQSGAFRAELPVRLVFPVAAVVAACVGGALGGSARYLRNKGKRGALLTRRVLEGMLVGLILVGAAWAGLVGFELGTGILGTPFGAFVLAALSGYLGCVVLDRVANKTFGAAKAEA